MCPACMATGALVVAGATSAGELPALVVKTLRVKTGARSIDPTPQTRGEQHESLYYNYDMREFPSEEAPGTSVFYKDGTGDIFHTYSCYARGSDILIGAYNYLDLAPKGRNEAELPWPMAWVRHHDRYGD